MERFRVKSQGILSARTRLFIRRGRNVFFCLGVLALSYVGYMLFDARAHQANQTRRFNQALHEARPADMGASGVPLGEGDPLGRIEIGRIGLSAMIEEGIDEETLRHAVGHIPGTPLAGQRGNVAFAGHRDTFFRGLRNIRRDDEITLTTLGGIYRYRVDSVKVVEPEETEVLNSGDDNVLTLVTCYPFSYAGPAPQRFIVRARQVLR